MHFPSLLREWKLKAHSFRRRSAMMVVGAKHKCTVGDVEKNHKEEVRAAETVQ